MCVLGCKRKFNWVDAKRFGRLGRRPPHDDAHSCALIVPHLSPFLPTSRSHWPSSFSVSPNVALSLALISFRFSQPHALIGPRLSLSLSLTTSRSHWPSSLSVAPNLTLSLALRLSPFLTTSRSHWPSVSLRFSPLVSLRFSQPHALIGPPFF